MKKLLTILFFLIASSCFGQEKKPIMDTVKIVMLCSDTLRYDRLIPFEKAFWQFGYLVTKTEWVEDKWVNKLFEGMPSYHYLPADYITTFVCYLDEAKDPLPKNIIVWIYK